MKGQRKLELDRPRSIAGLIGATFTLYARVPILFLTLAAVVVVPYELILLLITGAGPLAEGGTSFVMSNSITIADVFLITPLVSALHVHAVREVGDGGRPRVVPTFRQSLYTLPVVAIATGLSWIGILLGTLALIVPGLILWSQWAIVAQTAALEGGGWRDALRRSQDLTDGLRLHTLGLVVVASLISFVPHIALGTVFDHESTTAGSFVAETALEVLLRSFEALAAALLYFDLKARRSELIRSVASASATADPLAQSTPTGEPAGHPLDPASYSDEDRPPGWYVDPDAPWNMRYWAADGTPTWSKRKAKTPRQVRAEWKDLRRRQPVEEGDA